MRHLKTLVADFIAWLAATGGAPHETYLMLDHVWAPVPPRINR